MMPWSRLRSNPPPVLDKHFPFGSRRLLGVAVLRWAMQICITFLGTSIGVAQEEQRNELGWFELKTPRLVLLSDMPFDDELRRWPDYLDQAMEQWQVYFQVPPASMAGWQLRAHLIRDKERALESGLLRDVPGFDEGYQFADQIYLREQPSSYYRRHLFLHEATHWIMWKLYGGAGPAWFMEGMAELQGTHEWTDGKVQLGIIPIGPESVPQWGRFRMIEDNLRDGTAPTLMEILHYQADHDRTKRYAWSWAACWFFTSHPRYSSVLNDLYRGPLDYSDRLTVRLLEKLKPDWNQVEIDWTGFISDFDFGYVPSQSMVRSSPSDGERSGGPMQLETQFGWQDSGIRVSKGQAIELECDGSYVLRRAGGSGQDWISGPQGLTIRFYRGKPLGCVVASLVPDSDKAFGGHPTVRWTETKVGTKGVLRAETPARLYLKINEESRGLSDNQGAISVEISVTDSVAP